VGLPDAVLINQTVRRTRIGADAAIGVITTASFAVGVALISRYRRFTQSFDAALFGNILGVTWEEVAGGRRRHAAGRAGDLLGLQATALHNLR
jgi:ABC-type Mn2+/Zn2+ transport system permease subunit